MREGPLERLLPLIDLCRAAKPLLLKCARRSHLLDFDRLWARHSHFPESINLTLSLHCQSRCVFCPDRAPQVFPKAMPVDLIRKVLQEAEEHHFTGRFSLSENGEALTHPCFLEILGELRTRFPRNPLTLFSNMILMDDTRARALLDHGLTDLGFNFDGATEATYEYVKQNGKYSTVRRNITHFAQLRNKTNSPCRIHVYFITAKQFAEEIQGKKGVFEDDSEAIADSLRPLLREGDQLCRQPIHLQKYESLLNHDKSGMCEKFDRVLREVFVAPNGQCYICCLDFGNRSSLGNLNDQTIAEIWSSQHRQRVLRSLYLMKYEETFDVCRKCPPGVGRTYSVLKRRLQSTLSRSPDLSSGSLCGPSR